MTCIKNSCNPLTGIKILLFLLFLIPVSVYSQHDTINLSDTLLQEIKEEPLVYPQTDEEYVEESQNDYFLKIQESPGGRSIVQRHVPDSIVKKMQQHKNFWYANAEIEEEKKREENIRTYTPLGQQQWVQTLLWLIIIGGFAAAIMWYLSTNNVGLFRRKDKNLGTPGDVELETEDIFAINYQKEIDKAEANNNYRLATRLMFLRLLKDMAEKNIIHYKPDRTNLTYLFQLQSTGYYNHFFQITRNYEYSWYGQFEVGEDAYKIIKNDFKQINNQIR